MSFSPEKEKIANKFVDEKKILIEKYLKEIIIGLKSEDNNKRVNALRALSGGLNKTFSFSLTDTNDKKVLSYFSIVETIINTPIGNDDELIDEITAKLANFYRNLVCELAFIPIVDGLYSDDYSIIIGTLGALKALDDPRAVYPLLSFLERSSENPIILELLIQFKDEATKPVLELQDCDNKFLRRFVARYIGQIRHFDSYDVLINFLDDDDWNVRFKAIVSMGQLGDERAIEAIAGCTQDKSVKVRRKSAEVIGILASGDRILTIEEHREGIEKKIKYL